MKLWHRFDVKEFNQKTISNGLKFGHNCEFDFKPRFKELAKFGANIKVINYHNIWLWYNLETSNQVLLFIITKLPGTSSAWIRKLQCDSASGKVSINYLDLEWHY